MQRNMYLHLLKKKLNIKPIIQPKPTSKIFVTTYLKAVKPEIWSMFNKLRFGEIFASLAKNLDLRSIVSQHIVKKESGVR